MMESDVAQREIGNRGERFGHAVDERLYSDETGVRMLFCLVDQVFATAEPDFEQDFGNRMRIEDREIGDLLPKIDREARQ